MMDISGYYKAGLIYPEGGWPDGPAQNDFLNVEREREEQALIEDFLASNHTRAASVS